MEVIIRQFRLDFEDVCSCDFIIVFTALFHITFMKKMSLVTENPNADPTTIFPDGRFSHVQQVNDRLRFLRFLLKDGQLWLCKQQATEVNACVKD